MIVKNPRYKDVIFPYLNGEDLNSRPDQSFSRWVIQFDERSEQEARSYSDVWLIAEDRVKPERMTKDLVKYPRMVNEWWKHWNNRRELREAIAGLDRVLVIARASDTVAFSFAATTTIFSDATVIIAERDTNVFALLQSSLHSTWARQHASSLKGDLRYSPTDAYETFPYPRSLDGLNDTGTALLRVRDELYAEYGIGLTGLFNMVNDPSNQDYIVVSMREAIVENDHQVLANYGDSDISLEHDFYETSRRLRFTISERARREVLDRLLELNHQRYVEEIAQGLHDKGAKGKSKKSAGTQKSFI